MDNGKLKEPRIINGKKGKKKPSKKKKNPFETPLNNNLKRQGVPTNSTFLGKKFVPTSFLRLSKLKEKIKYFILELHGKVTFTDPRIWNS